MPLRNSRIGLETFDRHPASFRDPNATVFLVGDRILRGLTAEGERNYSAVRASGVLDQLESSGQVVRTRNLAPESLARAPCGYARLLEHDAIPFISYPYEWSFSLLQRAALLHLEIQIRALEAGVILNDASAYNVQFRGVDPVFIDVLSFEPYREGTLWSAHRQFCEQFLNPLLLQAIRGVPYNAWYRGSLEGLSTEALAALMPMRSWLSPRMLFHVLLPARGQILSPNREAKAVRRIRRASLPKGAYNQILRQLRAWISGLVPQRPRGLTWEDYTATRSYEASDIKAKHAFLKSAEFLSLFHGVGLAFRERRTTSR